MYNSPPFFCHISSSRVLIYYYEMKMREAATTFRLTLYAPSLKQLVLDSRFVFFSIVSGALCSGPPLYFSPSTSLFIISLPPARRIICVCVHLNIGREGTSCLVFVVNSTKKLLLCVCLLVVSVQQEIQIMD